MAAFHALEDEIIARLQRQMQMRHQARLIGERVDEIVIGLNAVERRKPQALQRRHMFQHLPDHRAEARLAGQVAAIARDVDAGQHNLGKTARRELANLVNNLPHWHGARIAAPEGDDAESAAVIAAVLHLHKRARMALDSGQKMAGGFADRHDVVDADALARCNAEIRRGRQRGPGLRLRLVGIAEHQRHFGHGGEGRRLALRGAAGDGDARIGPLALQPADRLARLTHRL